jgi:two-component system, NtrC family, response regulator AtoC
VAASTVEIPHLLVVSRESAVLRPLWSIQESNSWQIETAVSAWDAMERVQSGAVPSLLLLDLPRGDVDTLHVLRWLRRVRPDLPVIVTCFPEDASKKREAARLGAQDILVRPFEDAQLEALIRRHLLVPKNGRSEAGSEEIEQLGPDSFFVSASPTSNKLRAQAALLAEADVPVLILGEPGSGKDTVAKLIHKLSIRSAQKFLKVNCADVPNEMLEAELFGAERTSPQGTVLTTPGKFEMAEKGTIFLDEIAELPFALQTKLMQVLQDRVFSRAGSFRTVPVDVHLLAATSANIDHALAEGRLREDLYYRLSAFTVQVPPLRQRKDEIPVLLQHFMVKLSRSYGLPAREFTPAVLSACQEYAWPGNVKELETFVKRYLVAGDKESTFGDVKAGLTDPVEVHSSEVRERVLQEPLQSSSTRAANSDDYQSGPKSLKSLLHTVKCETERNAIGTALRKTGWNRKAAARLLRVSYRTMLYKIEQYNLVPPADAASSFHLHPSQE